MKGRKMIVCFLLLLSPGLLCTTGAWREAPVVPDNSMVDDSNREEGWSYQVVYDVPAFLYRLSPVRYVGNADSLTYTRDNAWNSPRGSYIPVMLVPEATGSSPSVAGEFGARMSDSEMKSGDHYKGSSGASYNFHFDTGDILRRENSDQDGNIDGEYAYTGTEGSRYHVTYKAGSDTGFLPKIAHLPASSEQTKESQQSTPNIAFLPVIYVPSSSPHDPASNMNAGLQSYVPHTATTGGSSENLGSSYWHDTSHHSIPVSGTATETRERPISFIPADGHRKAFHYETGVEKGFFPEEGFSPEFKSAEEEDSVNPSKDYYYDDSADGSYAFSFDTGEISRQESSDADGNVQGKYSYTDKEGTHYLLSYLAGGDTGFVAEGDHLPQSPSAIARTAYAAPITGDHQGQPPDSSYYYGFDTDTYSRQESSDAEGNVKGMYTYLTDNGVEKTVKYEAGADKGFVVVDEEEVLATESPDHILSSSTTDSPTTGTETTTISSTVSTLSPPSITTTPADHDNEATDVPESYANTTDDYYDENANASYAFSFDTGEISREEASDAEGNVQGKYAYTGQEGRHYEVKYIAGSKTGFVAEGDHIPEIPSHSEVSDEGPAPSAHLPERPVIGMSRSSDNQFQPVHSSGPISPAEVQSNLHDDGSYSFSYDAGDHSKSESADSEGHVVGTFSFVPDDGKRRTVNYEAGADLGFVPEGEHIPGFSADTVRLRESPSDEEDHAAEASDTKEDVFYDDSADASYAFSFNTGEISRQESSDADGNVQGTYYYTGKEGTHYLLKYVAGSDTGFVAEGDHLPQAPSAIFKTAYAAPITGDHQGQPPDSSYSYGFDTDTYSRQESSDAEGNVRGMYTYLTDNGVEKTVKYEAGADKGFVVIEEDEVSATGPADEHLSLSITDSPTTVIDSATSPSTISTLSSPSVTSIPADHDNEATEVPESYTNTTDDYYDENANASYAFSFDTGDISREETSDAEGNVQGKYAYTGQEGHHYEVKYSAGSETGFVAEGDHLPQTPFAADAPCNTLPEAPC